MSALPNIPGIAMWQPTSRDFSETLMVYKTESECGNCGASVVGIESRTTCTACGTTWKYSASNYSYGKDATGMRRTAREIISACPRLIYRGTFSGMYTGDPDHNFSLGTAFMWYPSTKPLSGLRNWLNHSNNRVARMITGGRR